MVPKEERAKFNIFDISRPNTGVLNAANIIMLQWVDWQLVFGSVCTPCHPELDSGYISFIKKGIDRFRVEHGMTILFKYVKQGIEKLVDKPINMEARCEKC